MLACDAVHFNAVHEAEERSRVRVGSQRAYGYARADAGRRGHIGLDHNERRPTRRRERPTLLINVILRHRALQLLSRSRSTQNTRRQSGAL